jgi:hypothetical protein
MPTQTTSRIAAFTVALMMNSLLLVGVAHLFDAQSRAQASIIALAAAPAQSVQSAQSARSAQSAQSASEAT